jgi:hypothetical protein
MNPIVDHIVDVIGVRPRELVCVMILIKVLHAEYERHRPRLRQRSERAANPLELEVYHESMTSHQGLGLCKQDSPLQANAACAFV